jgi:FMN-dependent NADH-azoreductase
MGIHDIEFIRAEGLNLGADQRTAALASAHKRIAAGVQIAA